MIVEQQTKVMTRKNTMTSLVRDRLIKHLQRKHNNTNVKEVRRKKRTQGIIR